MRSHFHQLSELKYAACKKGLPKSGEGTEHMHMIWMASPLAHTEAGKKPVFCFYCERTCTLKQSACAHPDEKSLMNIKLAESQMVPCSVAHSESNKKDSTPKQCTACPADICAYRLNPKWLFVRHMMYCLDTDLIFMAYVAHHVGIREPPEIQSIQVAGKAPAFLFFFYYLLYLYLNTVRVSVFSQVHCC